MHKLKKHYKHIRIATIALFCSLYFSASAQHSRSDNMVGATFTIQSEIMEDERAFQVFLPDGYADSDRKYPVLYILDGQRYFLHGVSLQKSFVEFRQTPQFIVVGVTKNPSDRNRNFSVNSQQYLNFLTEEVINYVDTTFRTSEKRMLFGWAYGGGFVIETMTNAPDLFDVYIAASPFPLTHKISKVDSVLTENQDFNKVLYFTSGTNEGMVREGTKDLNTLLIQKSPKMLNWTFRELEGEEHRSTPFSTLYHGIRKTFSYYPELQFTSLEEFSNAGGLSNVYDYYQKRADQFGFSNQLSDWTMFSLTRNAIRANDYGQFDTLVDEFSKTGYLERLRVSRSCAIAEFYLESKKYDKAIELFTLLTEAHPNSERPLNGLGDAYTALKKARLAFRYYKKAKKLPEDVVD